MDGERPAGSDPRAGAAQDLPSTMRAVRVEALGGPDALRVARVPLPSLRPDEVLVRTAYASVNFADVKARRGRHHGASDVPYVPGLDVSGTVAALGAEVEGLALGQRVAAATEGGAYAEWVRARAVLTYPLPEAVDDLGQAAGIVAMMTAYNVLIVKAALQPGETVLVHAGAGGVGSLLLQLARRYGAARVIAQVGSAWKAEGARRLGADEVLVARADGYAEALARLAPDGVDVALDSLGGPFLAAAFERLADFGRLVSFGDAAGDPPPLPAAGLYGHNLAVIGYSSGGYRRSRPQGVRTAAVRMLDHLAAGEIEVPVSRVYPLAEAADAHRELEARRTTGKLLLRP